MRHAIQLDFAGGRPALSLAGGLLLAVGVVAASAFLIANGVTSARAAAAATAKRVRIDDIVGGLRQSLVRLIDR